MDNTDVKIIKLLQENARISASKISKKINLSLSAVGERLRKLESSGVIKQYTTIVEPAKLGKDLMVFMSVSLESPKLYDPFLKYVAEDDEILEAYYMTGSHDVLLKIITSNTSCVQNKLNVIKSLPGVRKIETNVILSELKGNYSAIPAETK